MRGAGDQLSVAERVAFYRRRRGLTQRVLADLVGRSEDWLSKIERGEREIRRLDVLTELAQALRVTLGDLLGQPVLVEDEHADDDIPAIRDALMNYRRLSRVLFGPNAPGGHGPLRQKPATPALAHVARQVDLTREDFQAGRLSRVIARLPGLIRSAQTLEESATDPAVYEVSMKVHHLAATTLSKVGESDLAWLAAERAMSAADRSTDPLVVASAARAGTHALLSVGRYDDALQLGAAAASWVQANVADRNDPAVLSLCGMLYLRAAQAAARSQNRPIAMEMLSRAAAAAKQIGYDANYWQTNFGPTNVHFHWVAVALDLEDIATILDDGPRISIGAAVTPERIACYRADMARALSYVAQDEGALVYLLEAERAAPQLIRHSVGVRETVRMLYRRAPATAGKGSLLGDLAERCRTI